MHGCQNAWVTSDPEPDSDVFTFEQVSVVLGGTTILHDLDLRVPSRGITVVSGRSGSGKSTLTRLCNRLVDPSAGVVRHLGKDVRDGDVLALRRRVGMVFQRPTLFGSTLRDDLEATGVDSADEHLRVLESVGLAASFLERSVSTLSGGESQRACLARTLLMRPEVLVADEPTAALDEAAARSLEALAMGLANDGVPVLWVTHDLAQAERIADHRVTLDHGTTA